MTFFTVLAAVAMLGMAAFGVALFAVRTYRLEWEAKHVATDDGELDDYYRHDVYVDHATATRIANLKQKHDAYMNRDAA